MTTGIFIGIISRLRQRVGLICLFNGIVVYADFDVISSKRIIRPGGGMTGVAA